jgi:DNA-3-methyladenine glycosylase
MRGLSFPYQNESMTQEELRHILEGDVLEGARSLLGSHLVRGRRRAKIVETEAYRALDDPGSHAFRGPTPRNQVMFGPSGFAYVYFTYGAHWMLNITSHIEGQAAAVLIRAAQPLSGIEQMRLLRPKAKQDRDLLSGPGKIAAAFEVARPDNGVDLLDLMSDLRIEAQEKAKGVITGTRIGLSHGKGHELPWRFMDASGMEWVSKPHPK